MTQMQDGYYWARHYENGEFDGTTFIALLEEGKWFVCGLEHEVNDDFEETQIICPVKRPDH